MTEAQIRLRFNRPKSHRGVRALKARMGKTIEDPHPLLKQQRSVRQTIYNALHPFTGSFMPSVFRVRPPNRNVMILHPLSDPKWLLMAMQ